MSDDLRWWDRGKAASATYAVLITSAGSFFEFDHEKQMPARLSEKQLAKMSAIEQLKYRREISASAKIGKHKKGKKS